MKVLHVIDSEGFYGAETVLIDLVAEQGRQGVQATILNMQSCPEGEPSLEAEACKQHLDYVTLPLKTGMDIRGALKIVSYAQDYHFDIIHNHGYKANILLGLMPRWLRRLPVVATLHGWCSTKRFTKLWLFEQLDLLSLRFMDAVVVVNKAMIMHPYLQNKRVHIQVVNNGIPPIDFAHAAGALDQDIVNFCRQDGFVLGAIGRLSKEKAFDLLLKVLPRLKQQGLDPFLIIIGDGSERLSLKMLIRKYGLSERVFLAGYRDGARSYIPLFDLFVIPSLTEGLPITLLEAMQAKVPIIATNVGGIPEVLDYGMAGGLVSPGDVDDLAEALITLRTQKEDVQMMIARSYDRVLERYSSTVMADSYTKIYKSCVRT